MGITDNNPQIIIWKVAKLSLLLTMSPQRFFVQSFIEELWMCWLVVVKAPSNKKAQMSAILTVLILLTMEKKQLFSELIFFSLKENKL